MMYKKLSLLLYLTFIVTGMIWIGTQNKLVSEQKVTEILQYRISDLEQFTETFHENDCGEDREQVKDKHVSTVIRVDRTNQVFFPKMHLVNYQVIEKEEAEPLDDYSYDILCKIVEAEAGGEDYMGKKLVAEVVLNRVASPNFPNTVEEVVFQKTGGMYQFSPISDGRYYKVVVSEETKKAVNDAVTGENQSEGALYFVNRKYCSTNALWWFDHRCTPLFQYGGHDFFS